MENVTQEDSTARELAGTISTISIAPVSYMMTRTESVNEHLGLNDGRPHLKMCMAQSIQDVA